MHSRDNCHKKIWMLSGTGEGPLFARAFIEQGWRVTVSVVSVNAALPYKELPLEELWIGSLGGCPAIEEVLSNSRSKGNGFECVVDATHPFALLISADLRKVCGDLSQPLIRFERSLDEPSYASLINNPRDLPGQSFKGKNVFLALGSRELKDTASSLQKCGAEIFTRVLPSAESLRKTLACSIPEEHLAVMKPFGSKPIGRFEEALCRRWSIDAVVCRQSGGITQNTWQDLSRKMNLDLWMIKRPSVEESIEVVNSLSDLLSWISKQNSK